MTYKREPTFRLSRIPCVLGFRFEFETHGKRKGSGEVRAFESWRAFPVQVRWYDEHGVHYEWFKQDEFAEVRALCTA
jgi:hypothetical protein